MNILMMTPLNINNIVQSRGATITTLTKILYLTHSIAKSFHDDVNVVLRSALRTSIVGCVTMVEGC